MSLVSQNQQPLSISPTRVVYLLQLMILHCDIIIIKSLGYLRVHSWCCRFCGLDKCIMHVSITVVYFYTSYCMFIIECIFIVLKILCAVPSHPSLCSLYLFIFMIEYVLSIETWLANKMVLGMLQYRKMKLCIKLSCV